MNSSTLRRLGAAVIAPALAAGMIAAAPTAAQAAPNSYAYSAARWLSDQLDDGLIDYYGTEYSDYGLTLDVFFALNELDTRAADQSRIIAAFAADSRAYTGASPEAYAGATGKLATAVQASGGDASAFGGRDLIADTAARVTSTGRATDQSEFGDYSNSLGQSFVARALVTAGSNLADETVGYLLKQQCDDGSFRVTMSDTGCTTGTGTIDATAVAVQTLQVAKAAGQTGLQDDIDTAIRWLLGQQAADGGFSDEGNSNTNSTGLAAATLKSVGQNGAAGSAAAFLVRHQVTDAIAEDSPLANELGAIAFDQPALAEAKASGITDLSRGQFVRATAQAAIGVNSQLPATALSVAAPSGFAKAGNTVRVSASGLVAGEKYSVSIAGGGRLSGSADASGVASVLIATPAGTARRVVTVEGSRSNRVGASTITVLGARRVTPKLAHQTVKKNKTQTVTVTGLAAGERVRIYVSGKLLRSSHASSTGTYKVKAKVGKKAGKKTVKVVGAFTNRTGTKTFRVK